MLEVTAIEWQWRQRQPIDVVIVRTTETDLARLAEHAQDGDSLISDCAEERHGGWDTLPYIFRGIEAFMPWVCRVHLVIGERLPEWLDASYSIRNIACPTLHVVRLVDYVPTEYLPTCNVNTIALNLHRIPELSEQFICFSDDMFPLQPACWEQYFVNGLPCDSARMRTEPTADEDNDLALLNRLYSPKASMRKHPFKWFHPAYGAGSIRNLRLLTANRFIGFCDSSLPQSYLKSSFAGAWAEAGDIMDATCKSLLPRNRDISQRYIRYRQLVRGEFSPVRPVQDACFSLTAKNDTVYQAIRKQEYPAIRIVGNRRTGDAFEQEELKLKAAFEAILPERSGAKR